MNEKLLERKGRLAVEAANGLALKMICPWFTGMPDRLVLLPGGKALFIEFKSTGERLRKRQEYVRNLLTQLGFAVWVIDSQESLNEFIQHL